MLTMPFRLKNEEERWTPFNRQELEMLIPNDDLGNYHKSMVRQEWMLVEHHHDSARQYPYFYDEELRLIDDLMRNYYSAHTSMTVILFCFMDVSRADEELKGSQYNLHTDYGIENWMKRITERSYIFSHTDFIYSCYGSVSENVMITNQESPYYSADKLIRMQINRMNAINSGVSSCSKMLKDMGAKNPYELFESLINIGKGL